MRGRREEGGTRSRERRRPLLLESFRDCRVRSSEVVSGLVYRVSSGLGAVWRVPRVRSSLEGTPGKVQSGGYPGLGAVWRVPRVRCSLEGTPG